MTLSTQLTTYKGEYNNMNYGTPKVLPVTGGGLGFFGALNMEQSWMVAVGLAILAAGAVYLVRNKWRRNKSVTQR